MSTTVITYNGNNLDGGNASGAGNLDILGGSAAYTLSPQAGGTGATGGTGPLGLFETTYTNVAMTRRDIPRIHATFKEFNEKPDIRFMMESFNVVQKADTLDFLNVADFFHPLQNFSDYQKQTFVISPLNSVNLDPYGFDASKGEVSMIIARAYFLPEALPEERILFWDYKGSRYMMSDIMVLTGAIKEDYSWKGWDVNPFGPTGGSSPNDGGIIFTNTTSKDVKITIIIAN